MVRLAVINLIPISVTATQCNPLDLFVFSQVQPFQKGVAYPCGIWRVDAESECHEHWKGIRFCIITVGQSDASFHLTRLQHSALVHGSDGGTECRDNNIESLTNSISLIHTLAVSDGTATLPQLSIVIIDRFISLPL